MSDDGKKLSHDERAARLEAMLDDIKDEAAPAAPAMPEAATSANSSAPPPADASTPDLQQLDSLWDDDDDRDKTVIGTVPELVERTRAEAAEAQRETPVKTVIVDVALVEEARAIAAANQEAVRESAAAAQADRAREEARSPSKARPRDDEEEESALEEDEDDEDEHDEDEEEDEEALGALSAEEREDRRRAIAERAAARKERQRAKAEAAKERQRAKAEAAAKKQKQKQPKGKRASEPRIRAAKDASDTARGIPGTEPLETSRAQAAKAPSSAASRDFVRMMVLVAIVIVIGGIFLMLVR